MQYLGSSVPLNIPHFRDFAATVKFYTHPNDVPGIFSWHNNNSDLSHFLGQAKWHVTGLGSQTMYLIWIGETIAPGSTESDRQPRMEIMLRGV